MPPHKLRDLLERRGLKVTPQRLEILDYLQQTKAHPTADEVYTIVENRLPSISKATVYNTLNTLAEAGVIKTVSSEPGVTRYDANLEPHHHFVDTNTGAISDIPWETVDQLCYQLGSPYKIHDYQVTFYGEKRSRK